MGYTTQEGKIIKHLREYLIAHGYPPESIFMEYVVGNNRVDLAVIDPITSFPMQLFEVRAHEKNDYISKKGCEQLRRITQLLPNYNFTTFLVYPTKEKPFFKIKQFFCGKKENIEIDINLKEKGGAELNFPAQKNLSRSKYIGEIKEDKEKNIRNLKFVFFILTIVLAFSLFFEILLDIILNHSTQIITVTRLYVIILIMIMQAFPLISEVKFASFELSLLADKEKRNSS